MSSLRASSKGLEIVNQLRRQKGWNKTAEVWCDVALTSKATLKRFWGQQPIQRETFIRICTVLGLDSWEDIVADSPDSIPIPNSQISNQFEVNQGFVLPEKLPPVRNWVGRSHELEALKAQLLHPDTTANAITSVCVVGLAGIGKTTLASQLVRQLQKENCPFVISAWESLRSATGIAPRFDGIIDSLLCTLSNGEITAAFTVQDDYLKKTEKLVKLLKDKPCLVVIDNVETVLKTCQAAGAGYFANDCTEYAWLFKQLAETEHQSKVIFTSRETLAELPCKETHIISLTGLDQKAAVTLLQSFNLTATPPELTKLAKRYQGHPKALELVAALIRDDNEFQGQVGRFLQERHWLLIRDIESLIDEVMSRLSEQERTCLSRISVYQTSEYPLSGAGIAAQMPEISEYDLKEKIILALKRRQLLDYDAQQESYHLHPLAQEKTYRILCQTSEAFRTAHRQAYCYFLRIPLKPKVEWKDIQDIKPLLLAHHHACQAQDWDQAAKAISGTYESLRHWGYFVFLKDLYTKLIPTTWTSDKQLVNSTDDHIDILFRLGLTYQSLDQLQTANNYLQQSLSITQKINNPHRKAVALLYIGVNHQLREKHKIAIECLQACSAIATEIEAYQIQYRALRDIGYIHQYMGNYDLAAKYFIKLVEGAREKSFIEGEAIAIAALGSTYLGLKEYDSALRYYKQYIALVSQKNHTKTTIYVVADLGGIYTDIKKYQRIIILAQKPLKFYISIAKQHPKTFNINIFVLALKALEKYKKFMDLWRNCLKLDSDIKSRRDKADALYKLGIRYQKLRRFEEAIENMQSGNHFFCNIDSTTGSNLIASSEEPTYAPSLRESQVLVELAKTILRCRIGLQQVMQYYLNQSEQICMDLQLPLLTEVQKLKADLQENNG